ncbi:MAG: tetratricopeptide repeat protein [Rhodospirillales bacterium]|nr:tetratricopeptide repeat protein [Rhodospirillales bacterium]
MRAMSVSAFGSAATPRLGFVVGIMLILAACAQGATDSSDNPLPKNLISDSLASAALHAESSGDFRSAAAHYRTLLERTPQDKRIPLRYARALRLAGEPRQAAAFLEQRARNEKPSAETLVEMAKAYLSSDQLPVAARYLDQAMTLAPQNWEVLSLLGVVLDYQGKNVEARDHYNAALSLSPDNSTVLNNLGLSLAMSGDLDGAIAALERAKDQPGVSHHVRQNLALLLAMKGDAAGAERFARKDQSPEMVRANLRYFRALADGARTY